MFGLVVQPVRAGEGQVPGDGRQVKCSAGRSQSGLPGPAANSTGPTAAATTAATTTTAATATAAAAAAATTTTGTPGQLSPVVAATATAKHRASHIWKCPTPGYTQVPVILQADSDLAITTDVVQDERLASNVLVSTHWVVIL